MPPNHGTKTHPLSPKALEALERLKGGPLPTQQLNNGLVDRLLREGCELVYLPSPYRTHNGKLIQHIRLPGQKETAP